jgi:Uncharacterized conserved protein (DUF2303)
MTNPTTTNEDISLDEVIATAVANGIAAANLTHEFGDVGTGVLVPKGYDLKVVDVRNFEVETRLPLHRATTARFVDVESLAQYTRRYRSDASLAYIADPYGTGIEMLASDTLVASIVLDDHPSDEMAVNTGKPAGRQAHRAQLVLRPTAAARRWAAGLRHHRDSRA